MSDKQFVQNNLIIRYYFDRTIVHVDFKNKYF